MTRKRSLIALLLFSIISGGVVAYLKSHGIFEPSWWYAIFMVVPEVLLFDWYYCDSKVRSFIRPRWLNIAVAAAPFIAIPYYLMLSRAPTHRFRSLLACLAYTALCVLVAVAGAAITRYADKAYSIAAERNHITRKLAFWQGTLTKPLPERIGPAPAELVEYLALDNFNYGYPNKPQAALLSADFLSDVHNAFVEIPAPVQRLLTQKLAGIYFVEDLGGSGFTEQIRDASKPVAGYVVLDASVLQSRTANDWATWKENSPFNASPDFKLNATIEEASQDNRKQAIQYILLHELGHVLAIEAGINPNWNTDPKDIITTASYPFFNLSWLISKADNRYLTVFDQRFPQRKNVVYYFGAKLPAKEMIHTYEALERTNFATLYAATNPHDDFAEAFVSYVHTVLMGKPFEVTLSKGGKIEKVYKSCWAEERCAAKRKVLERFLNLKVIENSVDSGG
jgi:hypothetical protein